MGAASPAWHTCPCSAVPTSDSGRRPSQQRPGFFRRRPSLASVFAVSVSQAATAASLALWASLSVKSPRRLAVNCARSKSSPTLMSRIKRVEIPPAGVSRRLTYSGDRGGDGAPSWPRLAKRSFAAAACVNGRRSSTTRSSRPNSGTPYATPRASGARSSLSPSTRHRTVRGPPSPPPRGAPTVSSTSSWSTGATGWDGWPARWPDWLVRTAPARSWSIQGHPLGPRSPRWPRPT